MDFSPQDRIALFIAGSNLFAAVRAEVASAEAPLAARAERD